jgi:hypothetical protein
MPSTMATARILRPGSGAGVRAGMRRGPDAPNPSDATNDDTPPAMDEARVTEARDVDERDVDERDVDERGADAFQLRVSREVPGLPSVRWPGPPPRAPDPGRSWVRVGTVLREVDPRRVVPVDRSPERLTAAADRPPVDVAPERVVGVDRGAVPTRDVVPGRDVVRVREEGVVLDERGVRDEAPARQVVPDWCAGAPVAGGRRLDLGSGGVFPVRPPDAPGGVRGGPAVTRQPRASARVPPGYPLPQPAAWR